MWLVAAFNFALTAAALFFATRHWPIVGLAAVLLSQALIISAWSDAKFGTIANVVVFVPLCLALIDLRPGSLRSSYETEIKGALARSSTAELVTERDLESLPALVSAYLRRVGVVGKPRVRNFRATFHAQMRSGPETTWMDATAEQFNFYDEPSRFFYMEASRAGIPVKVFHRYVGSTATMRVRIAGVFTVNDAHGQMMDQSETVTMLNDLCLLAPAALPFASITWRLIDAHSVRATYTNAGHTVQGDLIFDRNGDLIDFVSNDRFAAQESNAKPVPWRTPISEYGTFCGFHLWKKGEARWMDASRAWTYGRFELLDLGYNVTTR